MKIKNFLISLIEKYHPFNVRYFKLLILSLMIILSCAVLILGWASSKKVRDVVTDDFNQQQLVVAKYVANQIVNKMESLKRELVLLSVSPVIQYPQPNYIKNKLNIVFSNIKEKGLIEVKFIDGIKMKVYSISNDKMFTITPLTLEDFKIIELAKKSENRGKVHVSKIYTKQINEFKIPFMKMYLPVWQTSSKESQRISPKKFSGVILFEIRVDHFIEDVTKEVKSGKTGYAWVIDESGIFLYHPYRDFVGEDAFNVRKGRNPAISFKKINEIQKYKMLRGEEGTSWYISGWHGGIEGEIKKLIAYTPIKLYDLLWSVAVVAPISEIEGAIHSIHLQQFLLQALIISIIIFGGLTINFMILSWSNMLEQEVDRKTKELRMSEQRYKSLIENAEDIIFTIDYNGNFLSINKYAADFFGKKEEEIIGNNILKIVGWPAGEVLLLMIQKVFDTKESKQITHLITIGENEYWFNTKLRRLWDEQGNIYAVLGISRDITMSKKKEIEEQRYQTERLASLGTLAAGVAHEINNPLGIILGFTDLLLERTRPGTQEYDILKTIEKQGLQAKRVVENLLSFARYSESAIESLDINKNIEAILNIVKNTLFLNRIHLELDLADNLPPIRADAREIQQVFLNIINNSIHAMKEGGTLSIQTRQIDLNHIEIRISDTGHGIKKEHRSRIFDPLFTTKKVGEGTGLGLSVTYGIVTKYGGTISFETKTKEESEETGTTFIITFPTEHKISKEQRTQL